MPFIDDIDLADRRLRPYAGMTDGQLRRGEGFRRDNPDGLFIGESALVIGRALDAGIRPVSLLVDERWLAHDRALVDRVMRLDPDVPVFRCTAAQFRAITGYEVVRGALACFARPKARPARDVVAGAHRVAVLEDITNYANMGAIFRSAAALGWDAVLVSGSCHDPLYRRCARVSMGAVFQVPWARVGSVRDVRSLDFTCAALALDPAALDLRDARLAEARRLAVVLGTEGDGLRADTIAACDCTVRIPMHRGVDSLNVAACAAIAFWQLGPA